MKLKLVLLSFLVLALGCSSSTTRSDSGSQASSPEGAMEMGDIPKKKEAAPQVLPPVNTTLAATAQETSSSQLDQAIQKQDDRAIAISARQILIQSPLDVKALNALAMYHFKRGEMGASKALLNKAIASNNQISQLFSNLGIVLQAGHEDVEALKAFREALKVDPYNAIASSNAGAYYAANKDYIKAQMTLEMAVQKGQGDWRTLNNYGVTLMALGKYPIAQTQLKKASELQPQNTAVLANYATLLIDHLGKPAEGLDLINRIRFIGPSPDIRKRISELEIKAKSLK